MIAFFANLFGYVLNFLYEFIGNYGIAIISFSILVKLIMLPISIKQQKTMKKSQKINEEMKGLQFKYKNDPDKLNQEVMALYKREKMSPFSGCFSAIIQIILLFSVFYLVRSPLTYMKKIDKESIQNLSTIVNQEGKTSNYQEIAIINYINNYENNKNSNNQNETIDVNEDEQESAEKEEPNNEETNQEQSENNDEKINIEEYAKKMYINMNFLGLDLSKVPTEDLTDLKVLIIPLLYVISSFVSIRITTNATKKKKVDKKLITDGENEEKKEEYDPMADANKSMTWFMPLMSISIACIAPLGLALYWLMNNILMIVEKVVLDKFIKDESKEEKANA